MDPAARILSVRLAEKWGQPVIVNNRPGASGIIGNDVVRRAAPDGYTLLVTTNSFLITPHVVKGKAPAPADITGDFTPVAMLSTTPMLVAVPRSLGVVNLKQLASKAKSEPGMLFAGSGNGSPMHMAGELFAKAAGVDMSYSPYRGIGLALNDVLGGHIKLIYVGLAGVKPHIDSGKLIPLAVLDKQRSPLLPDLPTSVEQGFPGTEMDAWFGMYGPKGMAPALLARINKDVNDVLREPGVVRQFEDMSQSVQAESPADFASRVKRDYSRYGRIIDEFKITAE